MNWSQYKLLISISDEHKREYYQHEAIDNAWTKRELERKSSYYEKDLEQALITHLQKFLLELVNGFTFVVRQKRILLEDDEFFADLVFYNRLLRCFVVVELKTDKLTHQDLGQLQMYVNYYDRIETSYTIP